MRPVLSFALVIFFAAAAHADAPLSPPSKTSICNAANSVCVESDPGDDKSSGRTVAARLDPGGKKTTLWAMTGWFRSGALSADGRSFVAYPGNLVPRDIEADAPILTFYRDGKEVRRVPLRELVPDRRHLTRTVSHYHWGDVVGVDASGATLEIALADGRVLRYDMATGLRRNERR
jgi:hypothetical protein